VALLAYGGLIEVLQLFVPNRDGEWGDWLADAVGIGIGALLAVAWLRVRCVASAVRR
jgi:VanZ family protein